MRVLKENNGCGLYSKMLNEGFNDIVLLIENEEIPSISSILCVSNQRLKSIIKDEKADTQIPLPDQITKKAFLLLCSYYGYGVIEMNEENVCELVLCCICLNEVELLSKCERYILNHQNETIVMNVINMIDCIPKNCLNDIKITINDYISLNCISILDNNEILKSLHLESLQFIITLENLLIPNEKYLLEKILRHYSLHNERIEDKEEKYNEVMKHLNWKEIDIREIDEDDLDVIDIKAIMKKSKSQKPINRKYGRIPNTSCKILNEMILNGFKEIDSIDEDSKYLLSIDNIKEEISEYLKESKYLIEIITILRIMKKLNMKVNEILVDDEDVENVIALLIDIYKDNSENLEEKSIVVECLSYFFDNKNEGDFIYKILKSSLMVDMLNNENIEDKSKIIEYIKNNVDEKKIQLILSKIENEEIKQKILNIEEKDDLKEDDEDEEYDYSPLPLNYKLFGNDW